jgi:hypothetical protein
VCPVKVFVLPQLVVSHNFTVLSVEPLARRLPEGLKATERTAPVCPVKVFVLPQLVVSHNFTVVSDAPLARRLPEGLKATDRTQLV